MSRAFFVAAGILLSRLAGLVRLRVFAYYFGLQSDAADAFNAAFRIPNLLRDLFAEGALSAAFVPTYARAAKQDGHAEAFQLANRVLTLLSVLLDGGAAMRGLEAKVQATRERLGPEWRAEGLLVVRGTTRNRALVRDLRSLFTARYPARSGEWLRALADPRTAVPFWSLRCSHQVCPSTA